MEKPYSQACENNRRPILNCLKESFKHSSHVLEIGSGTGQHAVFFAPELPHLIWQTSDQAANHEGIRAWLSDCGATNLRPPLSFTVGIDDWPVSGVDAVFSANTLHIMAPETGFLMLQLIARHLPESGVCCLYGPFWFDDKPLAESNVHFDQGLRLRGYGGIPRVSELESAAKPAGLELIRVYELPANNHLLEWRKSV